MKTGQHTAEQKATLWERGAPWAPSVWKSEWHLLEAKWHIPHPRSLNISIGITPSSVTWAHVISGRKMKIEKPDYKTDYDGSLQESEACYEKCRCWQRLQFEWLYFANKKSSIKLFL